MVNSRKFLQLTHDIHYATMFSWAIIYNTLEDLEGTKLVKPTQDSLVPLFTIGALYKQSMGSRMSLCPQDHSCISWFDKSALGSIIYVSFGSIAAIHKAQLVEMAWGLANSNQPFQWIVRPGSVNKWVREHPTSRRVRREDWWEGTGQEMGPTNTSVGPPCCRGLLGPLWLELYIGKHRWRGPHALLTL